MLHAAFATELELQTLPIDLHMLVAKRREPERPVAPRVLFIAHAHHGRFQQSHNRRKNLCARQTWQGQILFYAAADPRQRMAKRDEMFVFVLISGFAPERMVTILLAAPGITCGNLHMAIGIGADPDLAPRRRNDQRLNAGERRLVLNQLARWIDIAEAPAQTLPPDSRLPIANIAQADLARRLYGRFLFGNDRTRPHLAWTPAAPGPRRLRGSRHLTRDVASCLAASGFSASLPSPCRVLPSIASCGQ